MRGLKKIVAIGLVISILGQMTGELLVNASELITQDEKSIESIITPGDITVSQTELTPGEEVTISWNVKNGYYYGETVTAEYQTPKGDEYFELKYNWENGCYEYTYVIPVYAKDGVYRIKQLYNSRINIINNQLDEFGGVDLSGGDFTVTGGIVDEEAPIIDVSSLNVTPKVATPGDTILMQVKASDNTAVDYVDLYYTYSDSDSDESQGLSVTLSYNEKSGNFEYLMKITNNDSKNGNYHLNYIEAYDVLGNHVIITDVDFDDSENNVEDLSEGDFIVEGAVPDYDAPVIDFESFKIDKKVVRPGDVVTVEAKVSDASKIAYFSATYRSDVYQASYPYLEFKLDEETGLYKASFEVDENYSNGVYEVAVIEISDEHWNSEQYYGNDVNLDHASFTVEGGRAEFNAPEIDLDSIIVDKDTVEVGTKIKFSLYAQDDTAIESVFMDYFNHEVDEYIALELSYNQKTNLYELEYTIPNDMSEGLWELGTVYAKDIYGEYVFYYDASAQQNWVDLYDLSFGDFTVTPSTGEDDEVELPEEPIIPPTVDEEDKVEVPGESETPSYEDDYVQIKFEDGEVKLEHENGNYTISNVKDKVKKIKFTTGKALVARLTDEELIVVTLKLPNNAKNFSINGTEATNGEIILDLVSGTNVYPISLLDESGKVVETYSFKVEKAGDEGGNEPVTPPSEGGNEPVTPPSEGGNEPVTPPSEDEGKKDNVAQKPETGMTAFGVFGTGITFISIGSLISVRRRNKR